MFRPVILVVLMETVLDTKLRRIVIGGVSPIEESNSPVSEQSVLRLSSLILHAYLALYFFIIPVFVYTESVLALLSHLNQ